MSAYGATAARDDDVVVPALSRREEPQLLRARLDILMILSLLRRKYWSQFWMWVTIAALLGMAPMFVYLFLSWPAFASVMMRRSETVHKVNSVMAAAVYFSVLISGFQLHRLFRWIGVDPMAGNLVMVVALSTMWSTEVVDRVAVYLGLGWICNEDGVFHLGRPKEGDVYRDVTVDPDSKWIQIAGMLAIAALFMSAIQVLHFWYYQGVAKKISSGHMDELRDEDGTIHV